MQTNHRGTSKNIAPIVGECVQVIGKNYPLIISPHIESAQNTIDILMFDWRFYDGEHNTIQLLNRKIIHAADVRGVKVRAVVNFAPIVQALKKTSIDVVRAYSPRTMHNKVVIIDQKIVVIGSHNLTKNAFERNHEASVLIDSAELARHYTDHFNHLYSLYI